MIFSENKKPSIDDFRRLMEKTDLLLNHDAIKRPSYYHGRNGSMLEDDVCAAMEESAIGTAFEHSILKISGQRFPDIVAKKYYGTEVKSTKENNWTSTGSSILESTRVPGVERIFMTFGKLGGDVKFVSRPYEECLSGIAVTHMPRYLIDMRLKSGNTIFDKIGIPYETLRKMDNPIAPVSSYYRKQLKPGESLWWAGDAADETVPVKIRLWKQVPTEEKRRYSVYGCVNFPEIFGGNYDRYALWLTSQGVVDPHIRDQFSAGGQEEMRMSSGARVKFPGVYRRVKENMDYFLQLMAETGENIILETVPVKGDSLRKRLLSWCDAVSRASSVDYNISMDALSVMFFGTSSLNARKAQSYSLTDGWHDITCCSCGQKYRSLISKQPDGHKEKEENICPFCKTSNGSSMEWEFFNIKK